MGADRGVIMGMLPPPPRNDEELMSQIESLEKDIVTVRGGIFTLWTAGIFVLIMLLWI